MSKIPPFSDNPQAGSAPPPLPAPEPPVIRAPPPVADSPPSKSIRKSISARNLLAILLSLCLGLFLADAVVSLADDSLVLFFDIRLLSGIRVMTGFFATLLVIVIYGLMGLTPMIPKRLFLPLPLFVLMSVLLVVPFLIYCFARIQQLAWSISFCQFVLGLLILRKIRGGFVFRWPLVTEDQLEARAFAWRNLSLFLLLNIFVLLPAVAFYLVVCAVLAVGHLTQGFMALRPGGLSVQMRKYVRNDGKTIQLFPMSHVADPAFYHQISQSFPTNSIILMEGVTDRRNLLTNGITYKRLATALGLGEQHEDFNPNRGKMVQADVDVEQFATNTIDLLNLVMLFHSKGVKPDAVLKLMQYSQPAYVQDQLWNDLLRKRNRRLLDEIHAQLSQSENIIVPWGVAHMPEISNEIQKSGFRLEETREYVAIRFRSVGNGKSHKHLK